MWMLPPAYGRSAEYPWGLPVLRLHLTGYRGWAQTLAAQNDHAGCLYHAVPSPPYGNHRRAFLRSPVPAWEGAEEPKGRSEGLRFFSLFVAICGERRINTFQLSRLLAYCLTVLMHVRILILLSAKANHLGLLYFYSGNSKQWGNVQCCNLWSFPLKWKFCKPGQSRSFFYKVKGRVVLA